MGPEGRTGDGRGGEVDSESNGKSQDALDAGGIGEIEVRFEFAMRKMSV